MTDQGAGAGGGDVRIPFTRSFRAGNESAYVARALGRDAWDGDGAETRACETLLERDLGVGRALLTTSCTHALELAALALDISPGDEVIVPAFTFVSTANAFALRGARIVFCDIRPDIFGIDEQQLEALVSPRTKAIVPVHYAGVACAMDDIGAIARREGVAIVEDNAHGLYGTYRDRPLGSFGSAAAISFHGTKNISCGEGGALLVNDDALIDRAEMARQKGTDRAQFLAGKVPEYRWQTLGSSYVLSELLAAVLHAQLEARETITSQRMELWDRYARELVPWSEEQGIRLPVVPDDCRHPAHLFAVLMPTADDRRAMLQHLRRHGIQATFHYTPLHLAPMGERAGTAPLGAPVTEDVAARIVRLPLYAGMEKGDQEAVIEAVTRFRPGMTAASR